MAENRRSARRPCLETANAPKSKDWTAAELGDVVTEQPELGGVGVQVPLTQCTVICPASVLPRQCMTAVSPWRSTTASVGEAKSAQPIADNEHRTISSASKPLTTYRRYPLQFNPTRSTDNNRNNDTQYTKWNMKIVMKCYLKTWKKYKP